MMFPGSEEIEVSKPPTKEELPPTPVPGAEETPEAAPEPESEPVAVQPVVSETEILRQQLAAQIAAQQQLQQVVVQQQMYLRMLSQQGQAPTPVSEPLPSKLDPNDFYADPDTSAEKVASRVVERAIREKILPLAQHYQHTYQEGLRQSAINQYNAITADSRFADFLSTNKT